MCCQRIGVDAAWNYKFEKTADALTRLTPERIDIYYDNVGGEQLEVALTRINDFGNMVSSGMISVYMCGPVPIYLPLHLLILRSFNATVN